MQKDYITFQQHIFLILLFVLGNSLVIGINSKAAQDSWLSIILAALLSIPIILIYARILKLFPETDIFEIINQLFGKIIAKIVIVLMTWYSIHLCALVLCNFTEYMNIIDMPETPTIVIMTLLLTVPIYLAKSKFKTLGEWSIIASCVLLFLISVTIIFAVKEMDLNNLLPIFANGPKDILIGAGQLITFPFAESVVILSLGCTIKKGESTYKIYTFGIIASAFVMLLVILRNILTLGAPMISSSYFPSFNMARTIHIGEFLSRIEGSISVNLVLAGITKISVCLICAAKGISSLFQIKNFKHMILPMALLAMALCAILYKNIIEMFAFLKYYNIYAVPFQLFIPVIIWIAAERFVKKKKPINESQNAAT